MFKKRKRSYSEIVRGLFWPQTGVRRAWLYHMHRLARKNVSPHSLAIGVAAGAFASFTPLIGFHFILAGVLAYLLGGNLLASAVGTAVGNPLTFPFIWLATYNVGAIMMGRETRTAVTVQPDYSMGDAYATGLWAYASELWAKLESVIVPMIIGGIPLGLICAATCYWLVRRVIATLQAARQARRNRHLP